MGTVTKYPLPYSIQSLSLKVWIKLNPHNRWWRRFLESVARSRHWEWVKRAFVTFDMHRLVRLTMMIACISFGASISYVVFSKRKYLYASIFFKSKRNAGVLRGQCHVSLRLADASWKLCRRCCFGKVILDYCPRGSYIWLGCSNKEPFLVKPYCGNQL